mgnify:FL=1
MHKKIFKLLLMICSFFITTNIIAQTNSANESIMRSNGKIYVVMAVSLTILIGLILYLITIDRKIGKIEDRN